MDKKKNILLGGVIGLVVVLLVSIILISKPKKTSGLPINRDEQTTVENKNDNETNDVEIKDETDDKTVTEETNNNNTTTEIQYQNRSNVKCIESKNNYCLVSDDTNKIELKGFERGYYTLISINDNLVKTDFIYYEYEGKKRIGYYIEDIKLMYDNYVVVIYGFGPNTTTTSSNKMIIIDNNGNIITNTQNLYNPLENEHNHKYIVVVDIDEKDIEIRYGTFAGNGFILGCQNMENNNFKYDDIISAKYSYKYVGNGWIEEINHTEKTLRETLLEYTGYDNCDQVLDDWKKTGNTFQTR